MGQKSFLSTGGKFALPIVLLVLAILIVLLGVLPASRAIAKTKAEIVDLEADIKDQKALLPIFIPLERRKKDKLPEGIAVNELAPLKVEDLADLPQVFEKIARESNVNLVAVTPQVRSLQGGRELLRTDALVRGEFAAFKTLLNRLNEMSAVSSIESLSIDVTDLGHEMKLSFWLAIQ